MFVLQKAFHGMTTNEHKVIIRGKNNQEMAFNRDILLLFSGFIRKMINEIPCCNSSTPMIILPEIPARVLFSLQDLLSLGFCEQIPDLAESNDLLQVTTMLGLDIKKLYLGKENKKAAKDAVINVDNVRKNKKEILNIVDQRRKEGSQVVLVKSSVTASTTATSASSSSTSSSTEKSSSPVSATTKTTTTTSSTINSLQSLQKKTTTPPPPSTSEPSPKRVRTVSTPAGSGTTSTTSSTMISPLAVSVKRETSEEEPATSEDNTSSETSEQSPSSETTESTESTSSTTSNSLSSIPVSASKITKTEAVTTYMCEKCSKPFSTVILLKYHYCSHFMSLLKKNFEHLLDSKNTCQECKKNFQNSRRLLLHIGVNHDKINEILKSRGYKELPPHGSNSNASTAISDTAPPAPQPPAPQTAPVVKAAHISSAATITKNNEQPKKTSDSVFDVRKMMDIKNVPLLPSASANSTTSSSLSVPKTSAKATIKSIPGPASETASKKSSSESSSPPGPNATESGSTRGASPAVSSASTSDTQVNFELSCEVCKQKMNNLYNLEQHCCRHFMKELSEQFASLMDDLKCTVCDTAFKQKHKLLLHIGCKHGKINEILRQKGFAVLPCNVGSANPKTQDSMQKALIKIKKEKMDKSSDNDNDSNLNSSATGDSLEDFDFSDSNSSNKTDTTKSSFNPGPFSTELSEILKKYSNVATSSSSV